MNASAIVIKTIVPRRELDRFREIGQRFGNLSRIAINACAIVIKTTIPGRKSDRFRELSNGLVELLGLRQFVALFSERGGLALFVGVRHTHRSENEESGRQPR
jgi:hypothetical protein